MLRALLFKLQGMLTFNKNIYIQGISEPVEQLASRQSKQQWQGLFSLTLALQYSCYLCSRQHNLEQGQLIVMKVRTFFALLSIYIYIYIYISVYFYFIYRIKSVLSNWTSIHAFSCVQQKSSTLEGVGENSIVGIQYIALIDILLFD